MHSVVPLKVLYFGTPVVIISSSNEDGSTNIAPMSSAWWLGQDAMFAMATSSQTSHNLLRHGECVMNLVPSNLVDVVDRLALLTGSTAPPAYKLRQGYRHEPDKFAAARLTRQAADLVRPDRIAECPIQLECRIVARHDFDSSNATAVAFQATVLRAHVQDDLVIPGTSHVDPLQWDPLMMKFCDFFGNAENLHPSRLAESWEMPRRLSPVRAERAS